MLQSNQLKQINASYSGEWGGYDDKTEKQNRQNSENAKNLWKKELKGKQKPRVFYLLRIAFLAEMWRLPFNHWTVFLFFMSLSPSAHILPSLHPCLVQLPLSLSSSSLSSLFSVAFYLQFYSLSLQLSSLLFTSTLLLIKFPSSRIPLFFNFPTVRPTSKAVRVRMRNACLWVCPKCAYACDRRDRLVSI